ncbi:hypothetical protein FRB90_006102 [Tulasnella sp. 427]|nr:hypothetical protein FRB90_006102 [Tulasnella sp. 427]
MAASTTSALSSLYEGLFKPHVVQTRAPTQVSTASFSAIRSFSYYSSLSRFFSVLPQDIVYEVFGWLTPRELIKLAMTNRELRALLTERESTSIWKSSRQRNWTPIPDPHADVSELRWARLIFSSACEMLIAAGKDNVGSTRPSVSFVLESCRTFELDLMKLRAHSSKAYRSRAIVDFPSFHRSATFNQSGLNLHSARLQLEWHRSAIAVGVHNAEKDLEKYIAHRKALVSAVQEHSDLCHSSYAYLSSVDIKEKQAGQERLRGYLMELGHEEEAVDMALRSGEIDTTLGLSRAVFLVNCQHMERIIYFTASQTLRIGQLQVTDPEALKLRPSEELE